MQGPTEESSDYKDVSALVDRRDAPGALREAARLVNNAVRRLSARVEPDLAPRDRAASGGWAASYALANHYANGQEAVGAHAGWAAVLQLFCEIHVWTSSGAEHHPRAV